LGMAMAARIRIIATTISSSMSENPLSRFILVALLNWKPSALLLMTCTFVASLERPGVTLVSANIP
jgi:hypothetical protein